MRAKAEQQYTILGTLRTRVAAETLRDWLLQYRRGGFDALYPKTRADRGRPRRLPPEVAELLLSIKAEHPSWSVRQVIAGAVASGHLPDGVRLAHSTVHRLLRAEGLMSKPTATSDGADRRRFSYRSAGQLWMSDVMHGPTVGDGTRRRKSYLISFLDDAMVPGLTDRPATLEQLIELVDGSGAGGSVRKDPPEATAGGVAMQEGRSRLSEVKAGSHGIDVQGDSR